MLSNKSFKTVASFRITAGNNILIKSIEFARRGNRYRTIDLGLVWTSAPGLPGSRALIIAKSLYFPNCSFLVNSSDRIIRIFEAEEVLACGKEGEPEPVQKLQVLPFEFINAARRCRCTEGASL